jgi:hypothetical protein
MPRPLQHLRVLIANERRERPELLGQVVFGLGHDVIAREIYGKEVSFQHRLKSLYFCESVANDRLGALTEGVDRLLSEARGKAT